MPGVAFDEQGAGFEDFLRTLRPRILATWHSTTLFDALTLGVVPVTLSEDDAFADNFVFPFREAALRWPQDIERVETVLRDATARRDFLARRRSRFIAPERALGELLAEA
jgi:hypothetical protein